MCAKQILPESQDSGNPPTEPIKYERPALGTWCEFEARAEKHRASGHTSWLRWHWSGRERGMYIGWRTVHDNKDSYDYDVDEDGRSYAIGWIHEPGQHHEVWLFVTNERQNPVRVFPADVCQAAADAGAGVGGGG